MTMSLLRSAIVFPQWTKRREMGTAGGVQLRREDDNTSSHPPARVRVSIVPEVGIES